MSSTSPTGAARRPQMCPRSITCTPLICGSDNLCAGRMDTPESHGPDINTHLLCIVDGGRLKGLQVNHADLWRLTVAIGLIQEDANRCYVEESNRRRGL